MEDGLSASTLVRAPHMQNHQGARRAVAARPGCAKLLERRLHESAQRGVRRKRGAQERVSNWKKPHSSSMPPAARQRSTCSRPVLAHAAAPSGAIAVALTCGQRLRSVRPLSGAPLARTSDASGSRDSTHIFQPACESTTRSARMTRSLCGGRGVSACAGSAAPTNAYAPTQRGVRRRRPHSLAYAMAKAYWNTWLPNWPSWSKQATYSSAVGAAFLFADAIVRRKCKRLASNLWRARCQQKFDA